MPESEDDLHRFEAYKEKLQDLPIVGDQDSRYVTHISTIGENRENLYALLATIPVSGIKKKEFGDARIVSQM